MSVKARPVMSAVASLVAGCALAGDAIHFIGTANGVGKGNAGDITNAAKWGDGVSELSPTSDYIIDNDRYCGFGGNGAFPGHSLAVGVVGGNKGYLEAMTSAGTFDFGALVLNNGQMYSGFGGTVNIDGDATVNAAMDAPFAFRFKGQSGGNYNFLGDFTGSGKLRVYKSEQSGSSDYLIVRFRGDMSAFAGTLEIGLPSASSDSSATTYRSPVLFDDTTVGGSLAVNPCGVIAPCGIGTDYYGEFSVADLSMAAGSAIRLGVSATTSATVRVTRSLALPETGRVYLDIRAMPDVNTAERRIPVIVAPAGSGLSANAFEICSFGTVASVMAKTAACSLVADTSGTVETLYLVVGKYTYLNTKDVSGQSSWTSAYASHWKGLSDGTPIDPDTTYVDYSKQMVTPDGGANEVSSFGGRRLVLNSNNAFLYCASSVRIDDFVMMNGAYMQMHPTSGFHLYGSITIAAPSGTGASPVQFRTARGYTANIDADISGSGDITLKGSTSDNANCKAEFALKGDNSAFTGRIAVTNDKDSPLTNTTISVSGSTALGGARQSFAYNALSFTNYSRFNVNGSVCISEPTRGVYFSGVNYVNVPNDRHTLTLASQTTLAGTLVKEGAGTLALGGTLKFTSSQTDTPTAGGNVLLVNAGRIRPLSKSGADGLAISFATGTGIVLAPLADAGADVRRYGIFDVKWATPFDLTATGGKLDVALDLPQDMSGAPNRFSFGVCTVPSSFAPAVVGNIVLPSVRGYRHSIAAVDNGDGTVTFKATYAKIGFLFLVR